ncbi:MAG: DUF4013 domain-containing protein [Candidatus Thermoplasmatota archaeon]|nr:DUF4013 domain-containing protein [Candidatus Thermoplasmatota archaeon]
MRRGLAESYQRTLDLPGKHKMSFLGICVFTVSFILVLTVAQVFLIILASIFLALVSGALAGGICLLDYGGGIHVVAIILLVAGGILSLLFLVILLCIALTIGSTAFGAQIHIADLLLKMKMGEKLGSRGILKELKYDWKDLLRSGYRLLTRLITLFIGFLIVIEVVTFCMIAAVMFLVQKSGVSDASSIMTTVVIVIISIVIALIFLVIIPVLVFMIDSASMRMAEGKDVRTAIIHGLKDVRYNASGILYYILWVLILIAVSIVVFPLAFILQPLIPVLSKSFLIANRDMFYE